MIIMLTAKYEGEDEADGTLTLEVHNCVTPNHKLLFQLLQNMWQEAQTKEVGSCSSVDTEFMKALGAGEWVVDSAEKEKPCPVQ